MDRPHRLMTALPQGLKLGLKLSVRSCLMFGLTFGLVALLVACSTVRPGPGGPSSQPGRAGSAKTSPGDADRARGALEGAAPQSSLPVGERAERSGSAWVRVPWEELPGFQEDPVGEVLTALLAGCPRAPAVWQLPCERAARLNANDHAEVRRWMQQHLQPWRVEDRGGQREGLLTGYYEPHFEARRRPDGEFRSPVHRPPADIQQRRPYWTRQQLDTVREARDALRGRELAYLRDPIDVLVLQIQGSGRLTITEPDGRTTTVRMAFAAHNDHPYGSVGRWLINQGHLTAAQADWPGIRDWMLRNPRRVQEVLWQNPRVVFFREEPLSNTEVGPRGAMGIPLTPQRSIAVDPRSVPYGTAVWIQGTSPTGGGSVPIRRAVVAQDTGGAIVGAVRGDYFWGWGERAGEQAGRTRARLQMWALWPLGHRPPP